MSWLDGITDSMDMSLSKTHGDSNGQRSLACCSSWSRKESDTTERLNNDNETLLVATTWNGKVATGITWVEAVMLLSI